MKKGEKRIMGSRGGKSTASRRGFMKMLVAAASAFMAGCSRLNEEPGVQAVLSWFDRLNHKVGLITDSNHRLARTYPRSAVQPDQMRPNGSVVTPNSRIIETPPEEWRLVVGEAHLRNGQMMKRHWVREYTLEQLREMPVLEQTVEHICVEGWSAICHWRGVHLARFIEMHKLRPESRYVFFLCDDMLATANGHERYSVTFDLKQAMHPQNVLAYEYNGETLPPGARRTAASRLAHERGLEEREIPALRLFHERGPGRVLGETGLPALLRLLTAQAASTSCAPINPTRYSM